MTFITVNFHVTTVQFVINCILKYALKRGVAMSSASIKLSKENNCLHTPHRSKFTVASRGFLATALHGSCYTKDNVMIRSL